MTNVVVQTVYRPHIYDQDSYLKETFPSSVKIDQQINDENELKEVSFRDGNAKLVYEVIKDEGAEKEVERSDSVAENEIIDRIIDEGRQQKVLKSDLQNDLSEDEKDIENEEEDSTKDIYDPPDGGWGWVVTIGVFFINAVILGIHNCFALLFYDLQKEFKEASFKTAWVGSISFGCVLMFAPLSGYLSSRYGCRPVACSGILLASLSLFVSSFANSSRILYLVYGVGFGIGTSFAYTQGAVIVSKYFSSRHALASGIMLSGSSSGTLFMGKFYDVLHNAGYEWRDNLRFFSFVVLLTLFCAATYRPLGPRKGGTTKSPQAAKFITELSLWKNKAFMVWLVSVGLCKIGYQIPWVHMVKLSTELGFDRNYGSNLIQYMGVAATGSRLVFGKIADLTCINRLYLSQASAFATGLVNLLQPNFLNFNGLLYYVLALGFLDGGIEILLPVMTLDLVGEEELAIAWGCILCVISVSSVGPPIGGAMHDAFGSYDSMFYFAGTPMVLAAFTLALIPLWAKRQPQIPALSILSVDPNFLQKEDTRRC